MLADFSAAGGKGGTAGMQLSIATNSLAVGRFFGSTSRHLQVSQFRTDSLFGLESQACVTEEDAVVELT